MLSSSTQVLKVVAPSNNIHIEDSVPTSITIDDLKSLLIDRSFLARVSEKDFPINTTWSQRRLIFEEWAASIGISHSETLPILAYIDEQNERMKANGRKPKPRESQPKVAINSDTLDIIVDKLTERLEQTKSSKKTTKSKSEKVEGKWLDEEAPTLMSNLQWFSRCDTCKQQIEIDRMTGKRTGFRWRFDGKWHSYHAFAPCFRIGYEELFQSRLNAQTPTNNTAATSISTGIMEDLPSWEERVIG